MRNTRTWLVGLTLLALPLAATGQVLSDYDYSEFSLDAPPPDIDRYIALDDMIAFTTVGAGAEFESGDVDPNNFVECFNFNYLGCLEQFNGEENPYEWPVPGFWHGASDSSPERWMPELTDGTGIFAAPLRDFAYASNVFRYDFDEPVDIGEIVVWTEDNSKMARAFMHYDVFVSYDDSLQDLAPLATGVTNGEFGITTNPGLYNSSYTHVYDCASQTLATGVTKIRFVFYNVSYDSSDLFVDPWRGYWHPANSPAWNACEDTYPADWQDVDGRQKPFVASWIAEIDILEPQPAPLPGDGNGDGMVDIDDLADMATNLTGPDKGPLTYGRRAYDFELPSRDCDIDLVDVAGMQVAFMQ